jgi:hypothetical protein
MPKYEVKLVRRIRMSQVVEVQAADDEQACELAENAAHESDWNDDEDDVECEDVKELD